MPLDKECGNPRRRARSEPPVCSGTGGRDDAAETGGDSSRLNWWHWVAGAALVTAWHLVIWSVVAARTGTALGDILLHWDAAWYLRIVTHGYDAASAAFPPLFPALIRGLAAVFPVAAPAAMAGMGSLFSFGCLLVCCVMLAALHSRHAAGATGRGALLCFLLSPASYVFHSFHTESLFLLFSALAFLGLRRGPWWLPAVWAGLAALVRHQGVLLAAAIAIGVALQAPSRRTGAVRFVVTGLVSGLLWLLAPLGHWLAGRGPFPALAAHEQGWFVADSLLTCLRTLWFGNPIQNLRAGSLLHHAFYLALLAAAARLLARRRWSEGLYCAASLLIMLAQGELIDAFRFGAVLFPVLFLFGDHWERWPRVWAWPALALYALLNAAVTWAYAMPRWAY